MIKQKECSFDFRNFLKNIEPPSFERQQELLAQAKVQRQEHLKALALDAYLKMRESARPSQLDIFTSKD